MLGKFSCKMLDEIQNGQQLPEKNVLIGLQDMYRTPWLWQWGKLHLPISFYTRRICVLQGNIGRQCWGLFLLTSPEHAFVFAFHILLVFVYVFCIWLMRIRPQYLMTMLTMFWFVFHLFLLLCFHPVSVDLTCSTEVSIAPWALSPSIPPSRSTDSEKHVQRLLVKFVCWSGFQENVPPVGSPHPTWPLMRRWKSAWDLDRGCNKRENAGRPQTFALHPHFLNEPHAIHIWYSQFSVHMQISMFANIRFSC